MWHLDIGGAKVIIMNKQKQKIKAHKIKKMNYLLLFFHQSSNSSQPRYPYWYNIKSARIPWHTHTHSSQCKHHWATHRNTIHHLHLSLYGVQWVNCHNNKLSTLLELIEHIFEETCKYKYKTYKHTRTNNYYGHTSSSTSTTTNITCSR